MLLPDIGVLENVQAFGVGGDQAIFDSVVDHFHEVAGARWAAMEVSLFRGAGDLFAAGSARCVAATWREGLENGIEMADGVVLAADHLAVAAFESPDASASADVNVV